MNPDLWHSHGADRCGPPCSALESEDTCSALEIRRTCSALDVELSPLGGSYAQWPFWQTYVHRHSCARIAWPIYRAEDDPQLHGHGGGEHRLAPAEYGIEAAVDRARIAAGLASIAAQRGWLWMIPTCRDPSVATCDLPPRAAVWFESWPVPRDAWDVDPEACGALLRALHGRRRDRRQAFDLRGAP